MTEAKGGSVPRSGAGERILVAVLLAVFAGLAVTSMRQKNPTFDETAHLAAGVSYVQLGDHRLNPEHPVLPKLLAGAAASLAGARAHDDTPAWETAEQWDYATELLYERGADWRPIVFAGRLPLVAIGVLVGLVLWRWARAMAGPRAAAVALALFAFSPNFLAHTRLVTTDVPLTLTVVAAAACLWQAWRTGSLRWTLAGAGCVALSMLTKFSAFSYAPAWAVLILVPSAARPLRRGAVHLVVFVAAAFVLTEILVFLAYGFAGDWVTIRSLGMEGRGISPAEMSVLRRVPYEIMASIPWPAREFAAGMKTIILYTEAGHPVYLMGVRGDAGWWWSPFVALAVKATLPFLLLVVAALVAVARSRALRRADLVFLLVPAALVLGTNVAANLGIGVRHLLPMFPFLMILAAWPLRGGVALRWIGAIAVAAALVWHAAGTVRVHPHYLPWFNEIAGGARGGVRWLGDSNLDWGQDLSAAAARLREKGVSGAVLGYFGTASPFVEGLDWQVFPPTRRAKDRDPWTVLPAEGEQWLVMSVTNLQGVYYRADGGETPYPWLSGREPDEVVGGSIYLYEIGHDADVQQGMAAVYRRHGLREEEENALRRTVTERAPAAEARRRLTELYLDRGDRDAAAQLILRSPNPDVSEVLLVAKLHEEGGDLEMAETLLRRGIRGFPSAPELHNALAWFLQEYGGDLDDAMKEAEAAVAWAPDDPYYLDTRAVVRLQRGEPRQALEDLDLALSRPDGDLAAIRWHRAQALDALGRRAEARAEADAVAMRDDVPEEVLAEIAEWMSGR